jgi:SAM-dependent methyltransferase
VPQVEGAECVVGDCAAPPFPDGLFDAVLSCNIIDIVGMEGPLDAAARMLRPGGVLALSDPFYFKEGQAPPGDPRNAVRAALTARGLRVEQERDGVPWAWATYDRHWRLYFNYCLAARKS